MSRSNRAITVRRLTSEMATVLAIVVGWVCLSLILMVGEIVEVMTAISIMLLGLFGICFLTLLHRRGKD